MCILKVKDANNESESKKGSRALAIIKFLWEYVMLALGAAIAAFAIEEFLVPCTILDGGVVGISIMVNNLSGIHLSVLTLVLNIPFLLVGYKVLGKKFLVKAAFAMIVFSFFLEIFSPMQDVTQEYLLAVCFGGIVLGVGVGLVISFGGCLDGTETVAILLNRKFNFPVGRSVLVFNIIIFSVAGFLFGFDRAMYSLLTYYIASKVLDVVENGMDQAKAAMIITDEGREIADMIYKRMGRTVTVLEGEGLISGRKEVIYCVLNRLEVYELKKLINEVDASAFIAINEVSEIIGNHIKKKG
ncbi:MAG: YitT family protein [Lachnospiraceae bacterium]|nr:YitT family protein [Lachnospiraceae bacterium]